MFGFAISEDGTKLKVYEEGFHRGDVALQPPVAEDTYLQPDGLYNYLQPDGMSLYLQPA